jgi:hypothetical protein
MKAMKLTSFVGEARAAHDRRRLNAGIGAAVCACVCLCYHEVQQTVARMVGNIHRYLD